MTDDEQGYAVKVLGPISIDHPEARNRSQLSPAKQRLAAALVMARDRGVAWHTLRDDEEPVSDEESIRAAFRMSVSRLRAHLPPGSIEDIGDGVVRLTLEAEQVDAWHLLMLATTDVSLDAVSAGKLLRLLQPIEPFGGVGTDGLFASAARRIDDARHDLMIRLANERPDLLRGDFVDYLRGHRRQDPFNERLLATLVMAEAHSGDRRRALATLRAAKAEFAEVGLELSTEVADLESALLDPNTRSRFEPYVPPLRPPVPQALQDMRVRPHVGHQDELDELTALARRGTGLARVHGPSGVGKSRLCAELAHRAAGLDIATIYLRPAPEGSDSTFAPLLRSMPGFRSRAVPILERPAAKEAQPLLLVAALDALAERAGDGSLLLVVDDSQHVDSGTAELIRQLPTTDVAQQIVLVVVATEGTDDDGPSSPAEALADSAGARQIEVGPLDETDLRAMVQNQWPNTLEPLVWNLAHQLLTMSGGRAGVASILLASGAETDMLPDLANLRGARPIAELVESMPPAVARVGAAAAVLGQRFDLDALQAVTGLSGGDVLDGLDELVRRQLLRETAKGLTFEIVHAIVAKALLDTAPLDRIEEWHELAARFHADDPHRRALHGFAAGDRVPRDEVFDLLRASALTHLASGAYWEAVVVFRKALLLFEDSRLDLALEGSFARALELSGLPAEATRVRERAMADALAADDHATALDLVVSGLPEAELVDGDQTLVDRLARIDESKLLPADAFRLACHRSRQLAIIGEYEESKNQARSASALVGGPADEVVAVFTERFAMSCTSEPEARCDLLDAIDGAVHEADGERRADYYMLQAIDCYEAGRTDDAVRWRRRLDELLDAPLFRQWHGRLFDAMHCRDQGRLAEARGLRDEALGFGLRSGVNGARYGKDAADLIDLRLTTGFGQFGDAVRDIVGPGKLLDPSRSLLHCSGAAAILYNCGETEEAVALAEGLAEQVTASPVAQRTPALAFAAEVLAHSTRSDLVARVRHVLELRGRSSIVLGACVASVGPVAHHLAVLAADDGQRRKYLKEAVEVARDAGRPFWDAHCRTQLARLTGDEKELDRLRSDYGGTELMMIVDRV